MTRETTFLARFNAKIFLNKQKKILINWSTPQPTLLTPPLLIFGARKFARKIKQINLIAIKELIENLE